MFKFPFKKANNQITAPVSGIYLPIEKVSDQVFASKAVGDGFAISPNLNEEVIYSPVTGKVTSIFPTKHAITLKINDGTEVLLHFGIDTVDLNGAPFEMLVSANQKVNNSTPLVKVDWQQLVNAQKETSVIVVSANSTFSSNMDEKNNKVSKETVIGKFTLAK
ncbi:PTS glucose transporter subunit IIA [Pediococcus acidilactici]|uniref:PTS sugar transporter subunit IIA n=1 Tax=Pediococcus acidilactici TaxID=1254 RepID=UPI00130FEA98|nr:PTS glucose transporter subunit IIA [Pediococcus acidilactici]KAF0339494.1 PTS glucose transporter subunit IIA [Pediococcus acidilactici]KAF0351438.1 PTS glucose transporter subunit IIA [Pediococcus acidilactici]KAF0355180.1 PTS glucose transporter subunit IIA [Pediococcus acidilactici]KAF0358857.1 PTS glucose transporter subunit IIA [Pediococcus acidilactici]KAF0373810.1 PTS glucose transporter subunit IIA [Pediococcus acidilactici]